MNSTNRYFTKSIVFVLFIVFIFSTLPAAGQSALIPVEALHEDLDILKYNLEQIHAGLYTYTSKDKIDQKFNDIRSEITSPLTSIEFYRRIVVLHQEIKNGHTIIIPSEIFDQATATTTPIFPLDIYWDRGQVYILRNNSDSPNLIPGLLIDSINGALASQVFLEMSNLWTRDGNNVTFPEGITQRAFSGFYINFIGTPESYELVLEDSNGVKSNTKVKALEASEVNQNRSERYGEIHDYWQEGDGDAVTLNLIDNVAHLQIKTCSTSDIRKFGRSIRRMMNDYFELIDDQKVEHLIIDLRNNGGGDDITSRELFRHVSSIPFTQFEDSYLITRKIPNKDYYSENIGRMNSFAKVGIKKGDDNLYRLNKVGRIFFRADGMLKEHKPTKKPFKGQIYTLTNAYSFSAAGEIASLLKEYTNSLFIGEEPGGNATNVVAGEIFTLTLPHSKNRVRIPVVHNRVSASITPSDHGILPDYKIRNSIEDELLGRDVALEFTFSLIDKKVH